MSVLDEWVEKAEADYKAAVALNRRRSDPLPDVVYFHCQQSAEKYLKAYLVSHHEEPPYVHNLRQLLRLCVAYDASLSVLDAEAQSLNSYGVLARYPGMLILIADAGNAVVAVRRIRTVLRRKLGLLLGRRGLIR